MTTQTRISLAPKRYGKSPVKWKWKKDGLQLQFKMSWVTLFFIFFFATRGCATSQDFQCDPHKDDEQQLRNRLTRHLKISSDLPGSPNFCINQNPKGPQDELLDQLLTFYPHINELLLCDTWEPAQALTSLTQIPNTLKSLRLADTKKSICPNGMRDLSSLITHGGLVALRLSSIPEFNPESIRLLSKVLYETQSLQSLVLEFQNECGFEGASFIAASLENQTTLTYLHLYDCNLGNAGICAILNALTKNQYLRNLKIHEHISIENDSNNFTLPSLHENTTLTHLTVHGFCCTPTSLTTLATAFKNHRCLKSFHTSGPFYHPTQCATILGTFVSTHPSIEAFEISAYNLDVYSFVQHAKDGHLKKINWSHAQDQQHILSDLLRITSLTRLYLPHNLLQDNDISYFAKALPLCSNLATLNFSRNKFTPEGKKHFQQEVAQINPNLVLKLQ